MTATELARASRRLTPPRRSPLLSMLPHAMALRVADVAEARGITPDDLIAEAISEHLEFWTREPKQ